MYLFSLFLPDDYGGMLTRLNSDAVVRVCNESTIYLSLFSLFLPDDDGGMLTRLNRAAVIRACHGSTI
jgi:hypothetical protein